MQVGHFLIFSPSYLISCSPEGQPENAVNLEPVDVGVLIDFLMSLSASEFNRRQTFRIPLWESCGIRVTLQSEDQVYEGRPSNISLTGLLMELEQDCEFAPSMNSLVDVTIDFEGQVQRLVGRVRRRVDQQLGLDFPESTQAGDADPTPNYTALVMELQRRWAARRHGNFEN